MKAVALLALLLAGGASAASDAVVARHQYILNCAGCHQVDGRGAPTGDVPTLRGQLGHFLKLPEGRAFLVQVPGTSNSALNNAEVTRLLNWMANAFSGDTLPADFTPYTEEEVTRYRSHPLEDVSATRAAIVASLAARGITIK
ncbi:MAG: c-type cytochrome [Rhodocyclaceae bacterium]|nr:c-type cytochrome [Rhodocyclaceae bacterium]